jgi:hypothetical protein
MAVANSRAWPGGQPRAAVPTLVLSGQPANTEAGTSNGSGFFLDTCPIHFDAADSFWYDALKVPFWVAMGSRVG